MRLSKIKLAGFKSFVDPTTIPMPSNLIGIVGPNGCGKSNVIDAVRWVMGESSAKHLRGESMADVIFNGSNTRKPVGQATVELLFDNSDGTLGGQYAQYSEIAVKRVISRDGVSQYYQNGTRCRRRDITDIFLGTGLGPRSYSIIEQGMISRLIEAKPEELRTFIEEAAGISKYKERRKETETRIRHTRENLDRLTDLRDELGNQLERLQRQSKQAEKYKICKQEERLLKAQLTALRWRGLDVQITEKQNGIQEVETQFEAIVANLRNVEADIERQREEHLSASEEFNEIQGRFYSVGADIARVEQSIQHTKDRRQQHELDLKQAESSWFEAQAHVKNDSSRMEQLSASLAENQPQLQHCQQAKSASAEKLTVDEERMHEWQSRCDEFNQNASLPAQQAEVEKARLEHLEKQMLSVFKQRDQIQQESTGLTADDLHAEIEQQQLKQEQLKILYTGVEEKLQTKMTDITQMRDSNKTLDKELDEARSEIQELKGRHASLEALQQAAMGKQKSAVNQWLENHGYGTAKRLAEQISVDSGWESAVECVLGNYLQAICLDGLDPVMGVLSSLEHGSVTILDTTHDGHEMDSPGEDRLLAKVDAPWSIAALLGRVICVDNLEQAISLRPSLSTNQSVVTRDGIWLGHGWLRVTRDSDQDAGVLRRDQEMNDLNQTIGQLVSQIDVTETRLVKGRQQLEEHEEHRDKLQDELQIAIRNHAQTQASVESKQSQLDKNVIRLEQAQQQLSDIENQIEENEVDTKIARQSLGEAVAQMETLADQREELSKERSLLKDALAESRAIAASDREAAHEISLKVETLKTELRSTEENRERMQSQMTQLSLRKDELQGQITDSEGPLETLKKELEAFLQNRVAVEAELKAARVSVETLDHSMRELTADRQKIEQQREEIRALLEKLRMAQKELIVRRETFEESLLEGGHELGQIFSELPDEANEDEWKALVEKNDRRIQRLGAINLAAIDEYKQQAERKDYLDAQHEDLIEALTTLENAIRKIDKETRTRFKDTYDKINAGFQKMFPVLFGGGHSYLELTGEDLLDTGVAVMARPPGKRNSSIHQLSGGEKALTAVALVFSIFQLNPAPFCMLDEVDAPLDDANVARYCKLVTEMSEKVQFIVITHNKITMEMVHQLNGVTMQEPGVSRIVAVDVDAAAEMAVS